MSKKSAYSVREGDSDALNSYLRQLGAIDVPTTLEQAELCRKYEEVSGGLRQAVCRFGFSAREIIFHIDKAAAGEGDLSELFLPSSFENGKVPLPGFFQSGKSRSPQNLLSLKMRSTPAAIVQFCAVNLRNFCKDTASRPEWLRSF